MAKSKLPVCDNDVIPEDHLNLVRYWAKRFGADGPMDDSDQFSRGCVGLMHAKQRFDPSRNVKFSTYASFWIRAYMQRDHYFVDQSVDTVPFSNFSRKSEDGEFEIAVDRRSRHTEDVSVQDEARRAMEIIRRADPRWADIVEMRFVRGMHLREIGEEVSLSKERVRQILERAVFLVRGRMGKRKVGNKRQLQE